jgi:hypothetical protein
MSTPNPYAAPKAPVADQTIAMPGNFIPGGRAVPAGRGWSWVAEGWRLFKASVGTWIGVVLVWGLIGIALGVIPFVGGLASFILMPVFLGGIMVGCRRSDETGALQFGDLFAGFQSALGALAGIGALNLLANIAIMLVAMLFTGVGMFGLLAGGGSPAALAVAGVSTLLAVLIYLALLVPVLMALWFAPALASLHQLGAIDALKQSFAGSLKNMVPFLVYGLVLLVAGIVAALPFVLGFIAAFAGSAALFALGMLVSLVLWLFLAPVMLASVYAAYKDIYLG